jgi:hypothetical protein
VGLAADLGAEEGDGVVGALLLVDPEVLSGGVEEEAPGLVTGAERPSTSGACGTGTSTGAEAVMWVA